MAGLVFFYESEDVDVWSGRGLDAWNYAAKIAGDIDSMTIINKTSQTLISPDTDLDFQVVSDLPTLTGNVCYLCCPWDPITLIKPITDFDHANMDWYVFGPAAGWNVGHGLAEGCTLPQAGHGAAHAVHIATAAMFYRYWRSLA